MRIITAKVKRDFNAMDYARQAEVISSTREQDAPGDYTVVYQVSDSNCQTLEDCLEEDENVIEFTTVRSHK